MAVRQLLDRDRIVEIARVLAVDRDGRHAAKIGAPGDVLFAHRAAEATRFLDRFLAVAIGNVELADDDLDVDAGIVDVAQHLDDPPHRIARRGRPADDLHRHHLPRLRLAGAGAFGDVDVHQHAAVERHDERHAARVHHVAADDGGRAALEDADDHAFRPVVIAPPLDADDHPVAVHGLAEIGAGDVDVALRAVELTLGPHESVALRVDFDPPGDEVHPLGQAEMTVAGLDQLPGRDQVLQAAAERRTFFLGNLQRLEEFPHARGMVDALAHQRQDLLVGQHPWSLPREPGPADRGARRRAAIFFQPGRAGGRLLPV